MLRIDQEQCSRLAKRLDTVVVRPEEFVATAETEEAKGREANLWFFLVAVCQATRTLQGHIDGHWVRGWDYMVHAARKAMRAEPDYFTASHLIHATEDTLRTIFSDEGIPQNSTLDRINERLAQWHDASRILLQRYAGDVMNLYHAAGHRLRGQDGIMARLAEFQAYADPVEKKSFLFIMFAQRSGAWQVEDLENLRVAIDYHIMRIALRSGMVLVQDPDLQQRIKARQAVTAEQDNQIREAVREACDLLVRGSQRSVFDVDNILWMMGRNCCFYDYDPICGAHPCWRQGQCTFIRSIDYACPNLCLFDGVCLGSRDEAYRSYWETTIYTQFY
jgi:hypothetical protein